MDFETREEMVTRDYVTLGGVEVRASRLLEFLESVEGTDSMFPLRWENSLEMAAKACVEDGFVERTSRGSWFCVDEERREEVAEEVLEFIA